MKYQTADSCILYIQYRHYWYMFRVSIIFTKWKCSYSSTHNQNFPSVIMNDSLTPETFRKFFKPDMKNEINSRGSLFMQPNWITTPICSGLNLFKLQTTSPEINKKSQRRPEGMSGEWFFNPPQKNKIRFLHPLAINISITLCKNTEDIGRLISYGLHPAPLPL